MNEANISMFPYVKIVSYTVPVSISRSFIQGPKCHSIFVSNSVSTQIWKEIHYGVAMRSLMK